MTLRSRVLVLATIIAAALVIDALVGALASRSSLQQTGAPPVVIPTAEAIPVASPSSGTDVAGTTGAPAPSGADGAPPRAVRSIENPAGQPAAPVQRRRAAAVKVASVTGTATYYCRPPTSRCTRGYPADECREPAWRCYAAAGPELRAMLGDWRGQSVVVTDRATGASITVRLIDWCACATDHVIDLYWSALQALRPGAQWGAQVVVKRVAAAG